MPKTCSCGLHERQTAIVTGPKRGLVQLRPEITSEIIRELVETRRAIHTNPELSFRERETAALIAERLREIGQYDITEGVAPGYGVVAVLRGRLPGPTIALRADMDALPILESAEGRVCCSRNHGVMHACGHDGHVAILLCVARVLAATVTSLVGTVKLLFQPAEEDTNDDLGPFGGAHEMVEAGVLEGVRVPWTPSWAGLRSAEVGRNRLTSCTGCTCGATTLSGRSPCPLGLWCVTACGRQRCMLSAARFRLHTVCCRRIDPHVCTVGRPAVAAVRPCCRYRGLRQ